MSPLDNFSSQKFTYLSLAWPMARCLFPADSPSSDRYAWQRSRASRDNTLNAFAGGPVDRLLVERDGRALERAGYERRVEGTI
jgi:hypothetical protein